MLLDLAPISFFQSFIIALFSLTFLDFFLFYLIRFWEIIFSPFLLNKINNCGYLWFGFNYCQIITQSLVAFSQTSRTQFLDCPGRFGPEKPEQ